MLNRAYSCLEIKSIDEEKREIVGIATTASTDRIGDVVESKGAEFKLPLPLLWQHDASQPIGHVTHAKITKSGIEVKASLVRVEDAGRLKDRLDEAWQSLKSGLVRGLSIGFQPIEHERIEGTFGIRFLKWMWLELSAVTIPANADASITAIKSIDLQQRAALGQTQSNPESTLLPALRQSKTVVLGRSVPQEGQSMNVSEQVTSFEAKRMASAERMEAIMSKSVEEGRTLDASEKEEYDGLQAEIGEVDEHLVRLRSLEASQASKAKPVEKVHNTIDAGRARDTSYITVKDNLPKGVEFARYVKCLAAARGNTMQAYEMAKRHYPDQPRIAAVLKDAVAAGTTTDATWAGPLVEYNTLAGEFIEFLRPQTIIGKFGVGGVPSLRQVPFNIRVQVQTSGGEGYWVGQGAPKPVTSFDFTAVTMGFTKVANIAVLTEELVRFSNPSADLIVRQALADAIRQRLDIDFVDPAKALVSNVSPASITNAATPIVSAGTSLQDVRADVEALMAQFIAANLAPNAWIMSSMTALSLSMMRNALTSQEEFPGLSVTGGTFVGLPVIVSEYATQVGDSTGSPLILLNSNEIFLADDGQVVIDASREASIEMLDNPTNNSATGTPTTSVSMWQTNSVALRAERFINWQLRRADAVQYIANVAYTSVTS